MNETYSARDLWQTQVPYQEPDKLESIVTSTKRTMIHAAQWKVSFGMTADAQVVTP